VAVRGRDCAAAWRLAPALHPGDVASVTAAQGRWWPAPPSPECRARLTRSVTPLVTDLLSFKLPVPVVLRTEAARPGWRKRFVTERGDPVAAAVPVPLKENEREALRQLGYLE